MSRRFGDFEELNPNEKRVSLMRVANASLGVIAQMLQIDTPQVQQILLRPHVARFVLLLTGTVADELKPAVSDLSAAIKDGAQRAWELEKLEMEALHDLGEDPDLKPANRIRAKLGVVFTARDILDRAGEKAPSKVEAKVTYDVPPATVDALGRIFGDLQRTTVDVTPGRGEAGGGRQLPVEHPREEE